MGFWQGMNEGLTFVLEEKARKKELEAARQERAEERQASITLEEVRYKRQGEDRVRETMYNLRMDKATRDAQSEGLKAEAAPLWQLYEGSDNPKLKMLETSPAAAAKAYALVSDLMEKSAAASVPMDRETALDFIFINSSGEVESVAPDLNMENYEPTWEGAAAYRKATEAVTQPNVVVSIDPQAYTRTSTGNIEVATDAFNKGILAAANADLAAMDPEATEDKSKLIGLIEGFGNTDSQQYYTLAEKYGQTAYNKIVAPGDEFAIAAESAPQFMGYKIDRQATIEAAKMTIDDPSSTPAAVQAAKSDLMQLGVTYGR
jgi:hypothetical protein